VRSFNYYAAALKLTKLFTKSLMKKPVKMIEPIGWTWFFDVIATAIERMDKIM
jgi:hypothetical protein